MRSIYLLPKFAKRRTTSANGNFSSDKFLLDRGANVTGKVVNRNYRRSPLAQGDPLYYNDFDGWHRC